MLNKTNPKNKEIFLKTIRLWGKLTNKCARKIQ